MAFPVTKLKTSDPLGVTYSAPTEPDLTVRFKTVQSQKNVGGKTLTNFAHEIIINDANPVTVGSDTVNDQVSVRIRISGANESRARISEILAELAAKLVTWDGEDVFIGFEPVTAPGQV